MDFPDVIPADLAQFATLVPGRKPEFKVHRTAGLANSAIANKIPHSSVAKYQLINGAWSKIWEYIPPKVCQECGGEFDLYRRYLDPTAKRNMVAKVICRSCCSAIRLQMRKEKEELQERRELARLQDKYN